MIRGPFGNLASVLNAFLHLGYEAKLIERPEDFRGISHLVIPGVGSFSTSMDFLDAAGMVEPIQAHAAAGDFVIGICLGCQLLMESGSEGGPRRGLGLISGEVRQLADQAMGLRVPHTGWNYATSTSTDDPQPLVPSAYYYFNHEYVVSPSDPQSVVATTEYGGLISAAVRRENVLGVQFHPEKSQALGLSILQRFVDSGD